MTKTIRNWILTIIIAVLGLVEAITGFVLWLGLPSGGGGSGHGVGRITGTSNLTYWGLSRHTWIDIHDWVAVALVVFVTIHIALHWKWIFRMVRGMFQGHAKKVAPVLVANE